MSLCFNCKYEGEKNMEIKYNTISALTNIQFVFRSKMNVPVIDRGHGISHAYSKSMITDGLGFSV